MQDYKRYFSLSDSITTRDKDAITKTFSGLVKVIYPHGEYTSDEANELLEFAIECRKRVKQQLIKMDETFEEVDFSYTFNGVKRTIETLENEEYFGLTEKKEATEGQGVEEAASQPIQPIQVELKTGQRIIRDNQTGVSYKNLFGDYLVGVANIKLTDPYIRLPYQLRNLLEFCKLISEVKGDTEEVKLHLVTNNNEEYLANSKQAFQDMMASLEPLGIIFTYEFDDTAHDRYIELDNGWKIVCGRGLDIYQKTGGWYDIAEYYPEKRLCKACEITYLKG